MTDPVTDPSADPAADAVADIARTAGVRLSATLGEELAAEVEAELGRAGSEDDMPQAYADPVSIAGLIVAIASLAWSIYVELRRPRAELAGAVRQRWARDHGIDSVDSIDATAAAVIDVVAEETVKRGDRSS